MISLWCFEFFFPFITSCSFKKHSGQPVARFANGKLGGSHLGTWIWRTDCPSSSVNYFLFSLCCSPPSLFSFISVALCSSSLLFFFVLFVFRAVLLALGFLTILPEARDKAGVAPTPCPLANNDALLSFLIKILHPKIQVFSFPPFLLSSRPIRRNERNGWCKFWQILAPLSSRSARQVLVMFTFLGCCHGERWNMLESASLSAPEATGFWSTKGWNPEFILWNLACNSEAELYV